MSSRSSGHKRSRFSEAPTPNPSSSSAPANDNSEAFAAFMQSLNSDTPTQAAPTVPKTAEELEEEAAKRRAEMMARKYAHLGGPLNLEEEKRKKEQAQAQAQLDKAQEAADQRQRYIGEGGKNLGVIPNNAVVYIYTMAGGSINGNASGLGRVSEYKASKQMYAVKLSSWVSHGQREDANNRLIYVCVSHGQYLKSLEKTPTEPILGIGQCLDSGTVTGLQSQTSRRLNGRPASIMGFFPDRGRYNVRVRPREEEPEDDRPVGPLSFKKRKRKRRRREGRNEVTEVAIKPGNLMLPIGTPVMVMGLVKASQYNGRWGTIMDCDNDNANNEGRYSVQLSTTKVLRPKFANVRC